MNEYIYLKPASPALAPRPKQLLLPYAPTTPEVRDALDVLQDSPLDLDWETTGLDACDPAQHIVGVGLANEHGRVYLDVRHWAEGGAEWRHFLVWLHARGFWAFNG